MKQYGYQNVRGGKLSYRGKYIKMGSLFMPGEAFLGMLVVLSLLFVMIFLYFDTER